MNPFKNAEVVSINSDPRQYHIDEFPRGDERYVMSRGSLMDFMHNPHGWVCGYKSPNTKPKRWGTIMDTRILTPKLFESIVAVRPDTYIDNKGAEKDWHWASKTCQAWTEKHENHFIIKEKENTDSRAAADALYQDDLIAEFIRCSHKQVYVVGDYEDSETGIVVKIKRLIDLVPDSKHQIYGKSLGDLKTAISASYGAWVKAVFNKNYHVQAAMDLDMFTAATREDRVEFRHVVQESYAPFETARRLMTSEFVDLGRAKYLSALREYCRCLRAKSWPRYDDRGAGVGGWSIVKPLPWMQTQAIMEMTELPELPEEQEESDDVVP